MECPPNYKAMFYVRINSILTSTRDSKSKTPGPFEQLKEGENRIKVW
jgi:hypothetical protein